MWVWCDGGGGVLGEAKQGTHSGTCPPDCAALRMASARLRAWCADNVPARGGAPSLRLLSPFLFLSHSHSHRHNHPALQIVRPEDLAGTIVASELVNTTRRCLHLHERPCLHHSQELRCYAHHTLQPWPVFSNRGSGCELASQQEHCSGYGKRRRSRGPHCQLALPRARASPGCTHVGSSVRPLSSPVPAPLPGPASAQVL